MPNSFLDELLEKPKPAIQPIQPVQLPQTTQVINRNSYLDELLGKPPETLQDAPQSSQLPTPPTALPAGDRLDLATIQRPTGQIPPLQTETQPGFGQRADGTPKGLGFFGKLRLGGPLQDTDGVATEYSIGVDFEGVETQIPSLVPTLTKDELDLMTNDIIPNGKQVPDSIMQKAIEFARTRISQGKSPFAEAGEQQETGMPPGGDIFFDSPGIADPTDIEAGLDLGKPVGPDLPRRGPESIDEVRRAIRGGPFPQFGMRERKDEGELSSDKDFNGFTGRLWTGDELANAREIIAKNPDQFAEDEKIALERAENALHPFRALPTQIGVTLLKGISKPFGWGEKLNPGIQQALSKELQAIPGIYGEAVGEAAAEGVDLFVKWKFIFPALFKAVGLTGKIPYAAKAAAALKKATGLTKLGEVLPRTANAISTTAAAFAKGATVGTVYTGITAYNNGLSWEEAKPLVLRDAVIMGSIASVFNVASKIDTQVYVRKLRMEMIKANNQKYAQKLSQIESTMQPGPRRVSTVKGLASLKKVDLKAIDGIVSEVESTLTGIKAGKLYKTGQEQFESPVKAAQRFIESGTRPTAAVKGVKELEVGIGRGKKSIISESRIGEIIESARQSTKAFKRELQFGTRGEEVMLAVVKIGDQTFEGPSHGQAVQKAIDAGVAEFTDKGTLKKVGEPDAEVDSGLFKTSTGRIVDRLGARKISGKMFAEAIKTIPAEEKPVAVAEGKVEITKPQQEAAKVEAKIPGGEVDVKPGPAKTLKTIEEEGKQEADTTVVVPRSVPLRKIIPAKAKKKTAPSLETKGELFTYGDLGGGIGIKGKKLFNIHTQKQLMELPSTVSARKAATVIKESGIDLKQGDEEVAKQWEAFLKDNNVERNKDAIVDFLTGRGKELAPVDYYQAFDQEALGKIDRWPAKAVGIIQGRLNNFARIVPEFTLNPTFAFDKESSMLVFKDKYKYRFTPQHFGLSDKNLKDGQTIRFDLESFEIKPAKKKALKTAEAFLGKGVRPIKGKTTKVIVKEKTEAQQKKIRDVEIKQSKFRQRLRELKDVPDGAHVDADDIKGAAREGRIAGRDIEEIKSTIQAALKDSATPMDFKDSAIEEALETKKPVAKKVKKKAKAKKVAEKKVKPGDKPEKRVISTEAYDAARKRLHDPNRLKSGISPQDMADFLTIGAYHLESGVKKFSEWSKKMINDLGETVSPYLQDVWAQVNQDVTDNVTSGMRSITEQTPPEVQEFLSKTKRLAPLTVTKATRDAATLMDAFFAERDEQEFRSFARTFNLQNDLKEAMGNDRHSGFKAEHIEMDMAMQVHIDLKNNPDQIEKYYDKVNPRQKRITDLAQNLPAKVKTLVDQIIAANKKIGLEALDAGIINNVMDNYSMRLWETPKSARKMYRKFGTKTARAKHRTLKGILHGWSLGKELQIKGATNAHMVMSSQVANTKVDRQLIKTGKQWGLLGNQRLDDWKQIEHPNFTDWKWAGKAEGAKTYGKNFFVTKDGNLMKRVTMYAEPKLAKHLNSAFGTSVLYSIPGVRTLTEYNAMLKRWVLFTSLFHHQAYIRSYDLGGRTGFKNLGPRRAFVAGRTAIENFEPDLILGVRQGLTLGRIQDYDEKILRGKKTIWGKMARKVKPAGVAIDQINKLRDWNEHLLFAKLGPFLKAQTYLLEYRGLIKKHKKAILAGRMDIDDVAKEAAGLANDDFGGLHLQRIGRNPTLQHIFRLLALAPDWTESNVRSAVKAFRGGLGGEVYRAFWARIALKGLTSLVVFNYLMAMFDEDDEDTSGVNERFIRNYKRAWKNGKTRWMDVDITPLYRAVGGKANKQKYFSIIGHFKDPIKFVARETVKEGPLKGVPAPLKSLAKSAKYKGSIISRIIADAWTGKDWAGREFTTMSELMGLDDKGVYQRSSKKYGYKKGDPKGGKLKGELTKFSLGGMTKHLGITQIPSFLLYEFQTNTPIQVQNAISYLKGQMDGFDVIIKSTGTHISSTWDPAENIIDGLSLEQLKELRGQYVYVNTNRRLGQVRGKPTKGNERIVEGIDKAIKEYSR